MSDPQIKFSTFSMPQDRLKTLRIMAVQEGVSMNKLIRMILEQWMQERERAQVQHSDQPQ